MGRNGHNKSGQFCPHYEKKKVAMKSIFVLALVSFININIYWLFRIDFNLIRRLVDIILFGRIAITLTEILKITLYFDSGEFLKIFVLVVILLHVAYFLNQQYIFMLNIILTIIVYDYLVT